MYKMKRKICRRTCNSLNMNRKKVNEIVACVQDEHNYFSPEQKEDFKHMVPRGDEKGCEMLNLLGT